MESPEKVAAGKVFFSIKVAPPSSREDAHDCNLKKREAG
jgi:hypothetical protein